MKRFLSQEKINNMFGSRLFNFVAVPIMAISCFIITVHFYDILNSSFVFFQDAKLYYETIGDSPPKMILAASLLAASLDQGIKCGVSGVFFFFIYLLCVLTAALFASRK